MTLLEKFANCTKKIEEEYGSNICPEITQKLKSEGFTKYFFSDSLPNSVREEFAKALWDLDNINLETEYSTYGIGAMNIFYFRENDDRFDIMWVDDFTEEPTKHYILKNEIADLIIPFMKDIEL